MKEWAVVITLATVVPMPDRHPHYDCPDSAGIRTELIDKLHMKTSRIVRLGRKNYAVGEYGTAKINGEMINLGGLIFAPNSRGRYCTAMTLTPLQMNRLNSEFPSIDI